MTMKEDSMPTFVPSLSVFKDGAILSNIFLIDPEWEEEEEEMILKLGRHPDCDIVLDHPSISRWHLQIQLQRSFQELLLTDLCSVHGTFVCGQRATPKLPITLRLNDTFTMGTSTRVYKFHWLPYPAEEEVDCQTPPLSRIISTHEVMHGVNGGNEERALTEERHANAVESISRKLTPFLSGIVSEHDKEECGHNNEKREQASKRKEYFNADESIIPSNLSVYGPNKQECTYGDLGAGRSNSWNMVQIPVIVQLPNLLDSKKKWHMVVDSGCLIHEESLQALKQLEGIKGTRLIIPRIVIQELDCLKCQNKSEQEEAQEILRWIEQCMINKGWWVHVQSSAECFPVGDVMSPIADDNILECALMYERLPNCGHVVLLTNDVALKVKAMAEGMLCENAREFCQSLLSPYSERFLWSESTAHGRNWTDINNSNIRKPFGLTRKWACFGMMRNSLLHYEEPKKKSNEESKGLKLILLHDSHFDP